MFFYFLYESSASSYKNFQRNDVLRRKPSNQRLPKYVSSNFFAAENEVAFPCNTSCS